VTSVLWSCVTEVFLAVSLIRQSKSVHNRNLWDLKLGGDGRNTSKERARKANPCPSLETILHGIANEGSD